MLPETVTAIKNSRRTLEDVLTSVKPLNHDEWKAFIKITNAVATLQSIDFSKLAQLPMPEPKKDGEQPVLPLEPEIECPECHGRCTITVGDGTEGICATCKGIGKVKASSVKKIAPSTGTLTEAEAHTDVIQQAKAILAFSPTLHCTKETLDKINAINSCQSLTEKPPRLLGLFDLEGGLYACTNSVWLADNKGIVPYCHQVVEADKYTGPSREKNALPGHTGLKVSYKGKDYVLIGTEIQFLPSPAGEEKPAETLPPPRRRGRKSKADKKAEQQAIIEHPSET